MAQSPEELQKKTSDHIVSLLNAASGNDGKIDDSVKLSFFKTVELFYKDSHDTPLWSQKEEWQPLGDSLLDFIEYSKLYGLFPEDYHFDQLSVIRSKIYNDSTAESDRKDATLWATADVMLTDAFIHILKDIKIGRLPQDSISMESDSILKNEFYHKEFEAMQHSGSLTKTINALEPKIEGYVLLKQGIKKFLANYDDKNYTYVPSPTKDAVQYRQALQKRLYEGGYLATDTIQYDSVKVSNALKAFQEKEGITVDGKIGNETLRMLNTSDKDRFVHIAITMDRYKKLPAAMPERYVWVNLPSFHLQVWDEDTIKIISRIVCGKPTTRSPVLTSAIGELITYPKWTIPESIIEKEILPGVKKDPKYLTKKGYGIFDSKGNEINPDSINWKKYTKTIPYHVIQGSGDANALGVLKFNFSNKYAVYLHDTNERYLFGRTDRAMSHGCIRVQEWQKLADYVIDNDDKDGKADIRLDSMQHWLKRKEKHSIAIRNKLPLFIRYLTCEGKDGNIVFYNDIYGDDQRLAEKYFAGK